MKIKSIGIATCIGCLLFRAAAWGQSETHTNLQAVLTNGTSAWSGTHPFTILGVILNNPEEMLDSTWDPAAEGNSAMGAQWQMFFQTVAGNDCGGTACWMGQNYRSMGFPPFNQEGNVYSEPAWSNEMVRINYDTPTHHHFRKGDLVEVAANQSLFYGGKRNINEKHSVTNANNFTVTLVQAGYGLPDPIVIRLSDLVNGDDGNPATHEDIFDQTRQTGGERYQGMRVRLEAVRIATNNYASNGWGKTNWNERLCTVTDGEGRFLPLRMPLVDVGPVPNDWFSAVGIINQESGSGSDGKFGYELFVQEVGPTVRMINSGGQTLIYWAATYTNYALEYSTNLMATSGWQRVEAPPVKWISVEDKPAAMGEPVRFYRLKQQE